MKKYLLLSCVFIISLSSALLLPTADILKGIFASPAIAALFGAIYQIFRDESIFKKNKELQQQQQLFNLGAMSHMADVTFDKHIEFCEKYMEEVHKTISTLFREGPTENALNHAGKLNDLRQKYAAWITNDINEQLFPFEQALRDLGAGKGFINKTIGTPEYAKQRQEAIAEVWSKFKTVLTVDKEQPDENIAVETVKKKIREILDIEDLVWLRKALIKNARLTLSTHNKSLSQDAH